MNRERELLRHNIRGQVQRIWLGCSILRLRMVENEETIVEIELATSEILKLTDTLATTRYPRSATHMSILDRILQLASGLAAGVVVVSQTAMDSIPKGLVVASAVVSFALGSLAKPVVGPKAQGVPKVAP